MDQTWSEKVVVPDPQFSPKSASRDNWQDFFHEHNHMTNLSTKSCDSHDQTWSEKVVVPDPQFSPKSKSTRVLLDQLFSHFFTVFTENKTKLKTNSALRSIIGKIFFHERNHVTKLSETCHKIKVNYEKTNKKLLDQGFDKITSTLSGQTYSPVRPGRHGPLWST